MTPFQIKVMPNKDLIKTISLYRNLKSKSVHDELIQMFMENEIARRKVYKENYL